MAAEWCEYSVADLIPKKGRPLNISKEVKDSIFNCISYKEILRQSSEAVSFLHGLDMVHRNIHPDNFLFFCVDSKMGHYLIKLTDYKLLKNIKKEPKNSPVKLNKGWIAQEQMTNMEQQSSGNDSELTNKVDAFLMGCYYYYVLSEGNHPFESNIPDEYTPDDLEKEIKNKDHEVYKKEWNGGSKWNASVPSTFIHVC